jgi:hypothetical protein
MSRPSRDRLELLRATLAARGLAAPSASSVPPRADRERAPLSLAQERLYFLELYQPGTALHNDAVLVSVEGALELPRLARALAQVQERHEILRTAFTLGGDGPEQRIHPPGPLPLRWVDLCGESEPVELARALAREDARAPFDLERPGQWRVTLARIARDHWVLVLAMHHILSDGASMGLFFDELSALYADEDAELDPLPVQFGDYAAWERARLDEGRAAELAAWWRTALAGLPAAGWPAAGGARTQDGTQQGAQVPLELEEGCAERLGALARASQATTNQLLSAAWLALLGARSGTSDLCTGIASSLRQRPELRPLLGFFVQSLPLRVDAGGDPSFLELAGRVRAAALAALEHGELPFDRIARAAGRGGPDGRPLFASFFSHMKDAIRAPALAGARSAWEFVDAGVARFELALVLHETGRALTGFLEYDLGVLAPAAAERLAGDYARIVQAVIARPEARLSELRAVCSPPGRRTMPGRTLSLPPRLRRAAGE